MSKTPELQQTSWLTCLTPLNQEKTEVWPPNQPGWVGYKWVDKREFIWKPWGWKKKLENQWGKFFGNNERTFVLACQYYNTGLFHSSFIETLWEGPQIVFNHLLKAGASWQNCPRQVFCLTQWFSTILNSRHPSTTIVHWVELSFKTNLWITVLASLKRGLGVEMGDRPGRDKSKPELIS